MKCSECGRSLPNSYKKIIMETLYCRECDEHFHKNCYSKHRKRKHPAEVIKGIEMSRKNLFILGNSDTLDTTYIEMTVKVRTDDIVHITSEIVMEIFSRVKRLFEIIFPNSDVTMSLG